MSAEAETIARLAAMTDEGAFERLATAILRDAEPCYRFLTHPGVNAEGKTVKSPVDGIAFVPGAEPPHMIVVHHTISARSGLEKKWLHDPTTVTPRNRTRAPTAPPGDVVKTAKIIRAQREETPDLRATLILTTNQEPDEDLVRAVNTAGSTANFAIDIWSRSRLAHFLDNDAKGQWLRGRYLGLAQNLLSEEMLAELSQQSLDAHAPSDPPSTWVERELDHAIEQAKDDGVVFIIAASGAGKSVACYKRLRANALTGGFSLVLSDDVIASSLSIEQAIEKTLNQFRPSLIPGSGAAVLQQLRPNRRLLLAVEDINRSGRAATLIERIARWGHGSDGTKSSRNWQILCPVWPQILSSLSDEASKRINADAIAASAFSLDEGAAAVERRCSVQGHAITKLEATSISTALGHDPLLIALHDAAVAPDASSTIEQFIESCVQRLASVRSEFSPAEYRNALRALAKTMLTERRLDPGWLELIAWPSLSGYVPALRNLAEFGQIIRRVGPSSDEKIAFRHDRVRECLLAEASAEMLRHGALASDIAAEPYYAEIFGLALTRPDAPPDAVATLAGQNILALFCSVRHLRNATTPVQSAIVATLEHWLSDVAVDGRHLRYLRWEAASVLSQIDGPNIRSLASKFEGRSWNCLRAMYRNGDLAAGIELCRQIEPGVTVAGQEAFLDHVQARHGDNFIIELTALLQRSDLTEPLRTGALRLAGHFGEPALANAIRACWINHGDRNQHLDEYLWVCAQCTDDDPRTLLGPVCDGWAALPSAREGDSTPSPRDSLAAHNVRWGFQRRLPRGALSYFIERAGADPHLRWPITYLLHGVDHPDAVEFIVRELAATSERLEGTDSYSPFGLTATDAWRRQQGADGRAMSASSRDRLLSLWRDRTIGRHLRKQAFRLWAATQSAGDIALLESTADDDQLADDALWQRLRRGDRNAISGMLTKLSGDRQGYWWQLGRYLWSDDLTAALDGALQAVNDDTTRDDWILSELVMRLPIADAERLLLLHWEKLQFSDYYVTAALFIATPPLRKLAETALRNADEPAKRLKHLSMRFGYKRTGHPGISRPEQVDALAPYIVFLSAMDIHYLWTVCNENEWFELRRTHLDARIAASSHDWVYLDDDRVGAKLDEFLSKQNRWIDHWLDDFRKSGASIDRIVAVIGRWLKNNNSVEGLKLASEAMLHLGGRAHLEILKAAKVEPTDLADKIIADTDFGLKRQSLQ